MSEPVEADLSGTNGEIIRRYAVLSTGDVPAAALYYSEDTHNHGRPVGRKAYSEPWLTSVRPSRTGMCGLTIWPRPMTPSSSARP